MMRVPVLLGCDLRSLALLRVALGLTLLFDLLNRARDFEAHYGESGVLPGADITALTGWPPLSLHALGSND